MHLNCGLQNKGTRKIFLVEYKSQRLTLSPYIMESRRQKNVNFNAWNIFLYKLYFIIDSFDRGRIIFSRLQVSVVKNVQWISKRLEANIFLGLNKYQQFNTCYLIARFKVENLLIIICYLSDL
ncbi:LOW QUALITY PROTEIN: hypothetical protein PNEG_04343 [Pneumocystis murina B123]|uniref:Uncharacterized protein n=1 Tax=Pneumocystis murina (strain B123) TaxID=1069680 RepID=A0A0W4ZWV5_PNEMU|nr:LOW QUALITY PROTEIN: hypothetical protein PNEG_04343 [Pneumocystis murina B123]KTW32842.1 LOW QUALITY PROTEIN: hypothetical protein PNEG_04343 [Pneumocystis murina B123]